ncbi:uncharacterized protein RSE6_12353 [Rhynchosporium secalis]|uniref:Dolichyl-diphosphooligosaccharide--protein glycosyltransferase subunit 4 n=1 Tax=Rhynchosporium secalis TaxID=38038 RepID=A0A1E1MQ79_RHYSE|nr:uncharacterized protein RSE6_12353 [Rhynchosporium secalis]
MQNDRMRKTASHSAIDLPSTLTKPSTTCLLLRPDHLRIPRRKQNSFTMISDNDLYRLAVFLGSAAMLLIVLYHFLEINAVEEPEVDSKGRPIPYADIRAASIGR